MSAKAERHAAIRARAAEAVRCEVMTNGDLKITASNRVRAALTRCYRTGRGYLAAESMVRTALRGRVAFIDERWYEYLDALTSAPILSDRFAINGRGEPEFGAQLWWFPSYALRDPWRELASRGRVVFDNAVKK